MPSWGRAPKKPVVFDNVVKGMRNMYTKNLKELEERYMFPNFHSPLLDDADFDSKPMVLLIGQYSTGKTTFIKYILQSDFPGCKIGPEPTTDGFMAIMQGEEDKNGHVHEGMVPGNALVVDKRKPFRGLGAYGNAFLQRFQCSQIDNPLLKNVTLIDSPGILAGNKQKINRGYDFNKILSWFAERVDRIILLFDANKLDISDEFNESINAIKGYDDKVRVVLNKADQVTTQQLMRVYGALMWQLGKVITTPEVPRVYMGSFWDQPFRFQDNRQLFEDEMHDLLTDLESLPANCALRKLNDLIKRSRLAKVNALIISTLHDKMPHMFGKDKKKLELIKNLDKTYRSISETHGISLGDFPDVEMMREKLGIVDWDRFHSLNHKMMKNIDNMLENDVPELMQLIQSEEVSKDSAKILENTDTIFDKGQDTGINRGRDDPRTWIVAEDKADHDREFNKLNPQDGKISGSAAKVAMMKSNLPNKVLGQIWKLSDIDQDGFLCDEEFALAMHLIKCRLEGSDLPTKLPEHLIPPNYRPQSSGARSSGK